MSRTGGIELATRRGTFGVVGDFGAAASSMERAGGRASPAHEISASVKGEPPSHAGSLQRRSSG